MALSIRVQYALYTLLLLQILMLVLGLMAEHPQYSTKPALPPCYSGSNYCSGSLFFLVFGTPIWFIATLFVNQRSTLENYRQDQSDIEACASEKAPMERTQAWEERCEGSE
ncbi:hypothetical protein C8F01DRAFT_1077762 [Mycena amicta]|nr:hypothetical protein C8F01DRAFT_1077762 [Mycena amicta]